MGKRREKPKNPAQVAVENGWGPGTTLAGATRTVNGVAIDKPLYALITAIGDERVVARTWRDGQSPSSEHFITFEMRDWEIYDHEDLA